MIPGEVYFLDVPFEDRPGSKIRPVVVLRIFEDGVFVGVASTSQIKPNLNLIRSINFNSKNYTRIRQNGLSGVSYFYEEALRLLPITADARLIGKLNEDDFLAIAHGFGLFG